MTDKELFFKYNFINTQGLEKNELLNDLLKNNKLFNNKKPNIFPETFTLLLNATYNCNANCVYCYNQIIRQQYHNKIIDYKLLDEIIKKLGPNISTLLLHGGEPLLFPLEFYQFILDKKQQYNLNFNISLQSNGILLSQKLIDFFSKENIEVGLSFDGIFNDDTRGEQSTQAILTLAKQDFFKDKGIIAVLSTKNIQYLIKNYLYFKEHNIYNIQTNIVHEQKIQTKQNLLIENELIIKNYKEYLLYWIFDTNNPIKDIFLIRQIEKLFYIVSVCTDSDCIGTFLHIDPLGNIGPCGYFLLQKNFCNIKDIQTYSDIISNPKYINYFYKVQELKKNKCSNCLYAEVCFGGCIELNEEIDNSLTQLNKRYCNLNIGILDATYDIIKDLDLSNLQQYNPFFLEILNKNNYYSLSEIKTIEKK